jgi:hypothetical protein
MNVVPNFMLILYVFTGIEPNTRLFVNGFLWNLKCRYFRRRSLKNVIFTCLFNFNSLKICIKKCIVKKCCKEKFVLKRHLVCKKNCVERGCICKNVDAYETNAEFWSPLLAKWQVTFDVYCYLLCYCYLFIAKIVSFFNNIEISAIVVYEYFYSMCFHFQ